MNTTNNIGFTRVLIAAAVASVVLAACAAAPVKSTGAAEARNKLTQLQSDPDLATRAPVAIKEAEVAVTTAETPQKDAELTAHWVYLADRKVDTARALAETRLAEDQRAALTEQREKVRLDARTREADVAKSQVAVAQADAALQKLATEQARSETDAAQVAAAYSQEQSEELQRQILLLQAKPTDRGLVLTLGDVLFASGKADLKSGATNHLDKLVTFLSRYPTRTAAIEGYTDSIGSDDYNQGLSQRRAESVQSYLTGQGIGVARLSASGRGESDPVAGNDSASGRQQNRRVEVVISNQTASLR